MIGRPQPSPLLVALRASLPRNTRIPEQYQRLVTMGPEVKRLVLPDGRRVSDIPADELKDMTDFCVRFMEMEFRAPLRPPPKPTAASPVDPERQARRHKMVRSTHLRPAVSAPTVSAPPDKIAELERRVDELAGRIAKLETKT
jgi:hypothetical protein